MFHGSIVALVTPFKNGDIDKKKLEELVEFQITKGTHAIVPCGTTGESATMSHEEDKFVAKLVVEIVNKRVPVIAGTGSNNFNEALCLTEAAHKNGADAVLVVTPYYNKPTQEGLYQHYKKLAESVNIPIVMYNVPGRTSVNMLPETIIRLAQIPNIVAVKDATGNVENAMKVLRSSPNFTVLSGDDALTLPMMALGAKGVISVAANVIPAQMADLTELMLKGDIEGARKIHYKYMDLMNALFYETNPIPVKAALHMMGMISDEIRLPLLPMSEEPKIRLKAEMKEVSLL
ncbi:hypothetical protein AAG570_014039 [Ranatra chinensis]|uniref:4-hydroxy-2-oxoglutarate aldolase, mitochondrial n=1 Tax=Ranatra chinensis TaxID=642074 RepID=A0ABD0YAY7_9HEMI